MSEIVHKSNFTHWKLTKEGERMMLTLDKPIKITGLVVGKGYLANPTFNYDVANDIQSPVTTFPVKGFETEEAGDITREVPVAHIEFLITNYLETDTTQPLTDSEYSIDELGLLAQRPDGTGTVLFAYQKLNTNGRPEIIRKYDPSDVDTTVRIRYRVTIAITKKNKITVVYGGNTVYMTQAEATNTFLSKVDHAGWITDTFNPTIQSLKDKDTNLQGQIDRINDTLSNQNTGLIPKIGTLEKVITTQQEVLNTLGDKDTEHDRKIQANKEAIDELKNSNTHKVNKNEVLPHLTFNNKEVSNDILGNASMVYILRTFKNIIAEFGNVIRKDELRILSKDTYNDIMGISREKRNKINLEIYKGSVHGNENTNILKSVNKMDINDIYDGVDLVSIPDLGNGYSKNIQSGKGYICTIKFFEDLTGPEKAEFKTTYTVTQSDEFVFDKIFKYLYTYLTSPVRNGKVLATQIKRIKMVFSKLEPIQNIPSQNNSLNNINIDDIYLNLPDYITTNTVTLGSVYRPFTINEKLHYDVSHITARLPKILLNTTDGIIDTENKTTILNKVQNIQPFDKEMIFYSLGSYDYLKSVYSKINYTNGMTLDDVKTQFAQLLYNDLMNTVYTKGYKVPDYAGILEYVQNTIKYVQTPEDEGGYYIIDKANLIENGGHDSNIRYHLVYTNVDYLGNNDESQMSRLYKSVADDKTVKSRSILTLSTTPSGDIRKFDELSRNILDATLITRGE